MAKTALLAQNDNLAIDQLKQNVGRSSFDLSHSTTFPIDVDGAILPICAIECVPSDSFEISCECLLRQLSPLKVPLMTNIRLNTAFYYCDNRLAWKKWDRFIEGGRSGNEVYDIPRLANVSKVKTDNPTKYSLFDTSADTSGSAWYRNINYKNSLHTYFGISLNQIGYQSAGSYDDFIDLSDELPVAFPFFDYQLICRDNYTDIDRLEENPKTGHNFFNYDDIGADWAYSNLFPPDDDEIRLKDGIQLRSGFQSGDDSVEVTHGFILDKVRYHNVRDDYFTTSKKAPMRGDAPSVGIASATAPLDFSDAVLPADPTGNVVGNAIFKVAGKLADSDSLINVGNFSTTDLDINNVAYKNSSWNSEEHDSLLNALNKGVANVSVNAQITAQELRLLSQLTVWQELNILHKPYYNDFLHAHFTGVRVGETAIETPQYIGGTSQIIHINEIQQTSATTETSALGTVGATAHSLENNYVGKYYCNSYGWIIGVAYIQVDMLYNPAIPRSFSRRTKEDYYFPEFANLSMQAILNKEIFFSNDKDWNNTAWGYTGCYDELRSIPNHVAGDLLNSSYTDLKAWVLRREFSNDNLPSMSTLFLSEKGNVDKTAWAAPTMPAFMLQCANYIKAVRPMPYVAIPKAL